MQNFDFKKILLDVASPKYRPAHSDLNVLRTLLNLKFKFTVIYVEHPISVDVWGVMKDWLAHLPLMPHICVSELGKHRF